MPFKVITVRRWELWLPYCLLAVVVTYGFYAQNRQVHERVRDREQQVRLICQSANETRAKIIQLVDNAVPPTASPGALAFEAETRRQLAPVDCRKLVRPSPPKSVPLSRTP